MRFILPLLLCCGALLAQPADGVRVAAATMDLSPLTEAQQSWLRQLERTAAAYIGSNASPEITARWLASQSQASDAVGLRETANYLARLAAVLRGETSMEEAERIWRSTLDQPLLIMINIDPQSRTIRQLTIAIQDPQRARAIEARLLAFERGMPGFADSWLREAPTPMKTRIASYRFRLGTGSDAAPSGSYLPFDRTLNERVGRTWVVYENMIRANWWGEQLRPIALRLFPNESAKDTADALVAWYGMRLGTYRLGPDLPQGWSERFGDLRDPLSTARADVLSALLDGGSEATLVTLLNASFSVLLDVEEGRAPRPHQPAALLILHRAMAGGGLRFNSSQTTWSIDFPRLRASTRNLAADILAVERAGEYEQAAALFREAVMGPEIQQSIAVIKPLPRVKVTAVFARQD